MERPDSLGHNPGGIHVQAAVGLVEDGQGRVQHCHLEDLIALLLSSGEAYIDLPLGKFRLHLDESHLFLHKFQEVTGFHRLLPRSLAPGIDGRLHEVGDGDAGDLDRVLERHENACPGPFLRTHCQKIPSHKLDAALSHRVRRLACQDGGQCALAGPVRSHYRMDLALADGQVNALEYFLVSYRSVKSADLQQYVICHKNMLSVRCCLCVLAVEPCPGNQRPDAVDEVK